MLFVLVIALLVVWGAFLLPPLFRFHGEAPLTSTRRFNSSMQALRTAGRTVPDSPFLIDPETLEIIRTDPDIRARRAAVLARRRRVLFMLLGASLVTAVLMLQTGNRVLTWFHLLCDFAVAVYVVVLLQLKHAHHERLQQIRYMTHDSDPGSKTVLVLERLPAA